MVTESGAVFFLAINIKYIRCIGISYVHALEIQRDAVAGRKKVW